MGHTVPYTFVFKPQIYVLDWPLSYGHSYLYALCTRVINLKYKIQMNCSKYISFTLRVTIPNVYIFTVYLEIKL